MKTETKNMQDEETVRRVIEDIHETWNRYDQESRAALFAEDADFTNVRGTQFHGREKILQFHLTPMMRSMFAGSHSTASDIQIRFIKSDVASASCCWEMTNSKYPDGSNWDFRKGLMSILLTKENNKWLIKVMVVMELPTQT